MRHLTDRASLALADHAADQARALVIGLGMFPFEAAHFTARRARIDPRPVVRLVIDTRMLPIWRSDRRRPTSRPTQARTVITVEEENTAA